MRKIKNPMLVICSLSMILIAELDSSQLVRSEEDPHEGFSWGGPCITRNYGACYQIGTFTKYGKTSSCYKYISGDWTDSEQDAIDKYVAEQYPTWTRYRSATKTYNCHSYCWIERGDSNVFWIEDPESFIGSDEFVSHNIFSSVESGDLIVIYGSDGTVKHSVVALSDSYGSTMYDRMNSTIVCSKFGSWGLYQTTLYEVYQYYDGSYYVPYGITNK